MNEPKKTCRQTMLLFFAVTAVLAVVSIALRALNLLFFFDADPGYYVSGAILPILEFVILGISLVLLLAGSIVLFRKKSIAYGKRIPIGVRIGAGVGAIGFASLLLADIRNNYTLASMEEAAETGVEIEWLPILFGLGAMAYFVLIALNVKNEAARLLTGFCVILRVLNILTGTYFNFYVPMNAPDKLMLQLGILCVMLFLVNELRATVATPRPVLYLFFAGIATVILGAASLPSLIAVYTEILPYNSDVYYYFVLFGFFVYVTLRLLFLCLSPETDEKPETSTESAENAVLPEDSESLTESEETGENVEEAEIKKEQ